MGNSCYQGGMDKPARHSESASGTGCPCLKDFLKYLKNYSHEYFN